MSLPKFTPHMLRNQPDQTAYLLNKLVEDHGGGSGSGGKLYNETGQNTDGAMTQKATTDALGTKANTVDVGNALAGKVDKEVGKGLSSNDFTDTYKQKLNSLGDIPINLDLAHYTYTADYTWAELKGFVNNNRTFSFSLPGMGSGTYYFVTTTALSTEINSDEYIILSAATFYNDPNDETLPYISVGIILDDSGNFEIAGDIMISASSFYDYLPSNIVYHDDPGPLVPVTPYVSFTDLIWSGILDKIYPVGSIYMSATITTAADVTTALGGGTWVAWGSGKVPVGVDTNDTDFDTAEETGGAKTHRHDFAIGMHAYFGSIVDDNWISGASGSGAYSYSQGTYSKSKSWDTTKTSATLRNNCLQTSTTTYNESTRQSVGDTDMASTLQPYITCYMYKRTA